MVSFCKAWKTGIYAIASWTYVYKRVGAAGSEHQRKRETGVDMSRPPSRPIPIQLILLVICCRIYPVNIEISAHYLLILNQIHALIDSILMNLDPNILESSRLPILRKSTSLLEQQYLQVIAEATVISRRRRGFPFSTNHHGLILKYALMPLVISSDPENCASICLGKVVYRRYRAQPSSRLAS